ncbi:MAG: response regulator [Planctomycetota bacterium]|nr:response regulator [Planctomycetota bacterium]
MKKDVFTTGQVARICKVAPRTVSKWFDSGRLRGYRIPGSQDRRIPRDHLIRFLKDHDMPLGELEKEGWHKVLVIGAEKLFIDRVKNLMPEADDFRYEVANSGFEAGIQAESFHPDTIIVDLAMGRSEGLQIAVNLRKNPAYAETVIIAMASEDEASPEKLIESYGLNEVFKKPFDTALLAELVRRKILEKADL